MKKRILFICLGCSILALSYWAYLYVYKYHYKIIWDHKKEWAEKVQEIQDSYDANPNAADAYYLLDIYYGRGEYDKALYYADKCLKFGLNDTRANGRIHFFIARSHFELNQKDKARIFLLKAIDLSSPKFNEFYEVIKKYKMDSLLSEKEWQAVILKQQKQGL